MQAVRKHIKDNIKDYAILILIFLIGLMSGSVVLNNSNDNQREEITGYFTNFTEEARSGKKVDYHNMLINIMKKNLFLILIMAFLGLSVIGAPGMYLIILNKGFSIGYTISGAIAVLGTGKGLMLVSSIMFLSKLIELPAIFFLAVSGINSFRLIIKDRSMENIRYVGIRFIIEILIGIAMLTISSLIETYLSSNLFISISKYL